jgi:hypothetical protein
MNNLIDFLCLHYTMKNDLVINKLKKTLTDIEIVSKKKHIGISVIFLLFT